MVKSSFKLLNKKSSHHQHDESNESVFEKNGEAAAAENEAETATSE